jgi:hypothetical protein
VKNFEILGGSKTYRKRADNKKAKYSEKVIKKHEK